MVVVVLFLLQLFITTLLLTRASSCSMSSSSTRTPAIFIAHGGGPMPLLGRQDDLVNSWREMRQQLFPTPTSLPKAILLVSAHYEERTMKFGSSPQPGMDYDYGGFPPETYKYKYPAPGLPELAAKANSLLRAANIKSSTEAKDFDHGVFVPLMLMFPEATIPVVPVSVLSSQNAEEHLQVGAALSPLRDEGVLIIGSGSSSHNMRLLGRSGSFGRKFNEQLAAVLTDEKISLSVAVSRMNDYLNWEGAQEAQLKGLAEHLMPVFTVAGSSKFFQSAKSTAQCGDEARTDLASAISQREGVVPPIASFVDGNWVMSQYIFPE